MTSSLNVALHQSRESILRSTCLAITGGNMWTLEENITKDWIWGLPSNTLGQKTVQSTLFPW